MLRAIATWFLIMFAETVHGAIRVLLLQPIFGDLRSRQFGVFTGCVLILVIALLCVRWMRADSAVQLLLAGALWVGLTLIFELVLGVFVMGYGMNRITEDYDPTRGGLMGFGLSFMFFAPLIAARIRKVGPFRRAV